jgi:pimeloyl-ACP methyl ester carboxylesterase
MKPRMGAARWVMAVLGILLIALAWWQILGLMRGLTVRTSTEGGVPMRFLVPEGSLDVPGVVVAHGFAGSQQLMLGYGYMLARAGYGVVLFDFAGHGSNSDLLEADEDRLQTNLSQAAAYLRAQAEVGAGDIALLGHSMGSGAVMQAAVESPERYLATVAVSPTGADVTPDRPRNILYQAGTLEPQFLDNAERLLAESGGPSDDFAAGLARGLVAVSNVEHITILFSETSHQAALDWLNRAFARPSQPTAGDTRIIWYMVHAAGWLVLAVAVGPLLPIGQAAPGTKRPPWHWAGLIASVALSTIFLLGLGQMVELRALGGLLVGGAIGLWFLLLGLLWILIGFQPPRPTLTDLGWGLALFALLWVAVGIMAQLVWLPWLLIPERLARWPFLALAVVPWLLGSGLLIEGQSAARRLLWWLVQSLILVAGLAAVAFTVPGLFFIALLIPIVPVILAIMMLAGSVIDRPWSFALGNALFFGWLLAAVFPLA